MPFPSLRFDQFCDFRQKVCFSHLDPKGLESCHFIRLLNSIHFSLLSERVFPSFLLTSKGNSDFFTLCTSI
ncbi:hypothetical protein Hanom_Chr16g01499181 [Helianthus anomalus]